MDKTVIYIENLKSKKDHKISFMAYEMTSFPCIELSSILMGCKYSKVRKSTQSIDDHIHIR